MGLPIWKDPDEESLKKEAGKSDPTAAARSPIRRRPSIHGGRRNNRIRLPRDPTLAPPRFERSPPPSSGYNGSRSPRRSSHRGVPPISTLLESADRRSAAPPPPPRIEAPNDYGLPVVPAPANRERQLRDSVAWLQDRATRLDRLSREDVTRAGRAQPTSEERLRIPPLAEDEAQHDEHLSVPRTSILTRENTPFHRSPEPISHSASGRYLTPPAEQSDEADSLFIPEQAEFGRSHTTRSTHPLSHSWRPESPINGLGDRNRSPTPPDVWEVMQTTITPDESLPSADSSFTSAAASHSFTSNETSITEPDREPRGIRRANRSDGAEDDEDRLDEARRRALVEDDLAERQATALYAQDMFYHETRTTEGMERIFRHRRLQAEEGNKFALAGESEEIELGFRLIDEALDSDEGRRRVFEVSQRRPREANSFEHWIFSRRRDLPREGYQTPEGELPCPQPERQTTTSQDAAREANAAVHHYFRRFTADSLAATQGSSRSSRHRSPPPRYEPPVSHSNAEGEVLISHDPPAPHPVSPPSARSEREMGDLLLSGDEQDLNAVRRVVERLAQRDDVPEEWWMSMGLNLSRSRARSRSPASIRRINIDRPRDLTRAAADVDGRTGRNGARL